MKLRPYSMILFNPHILPRMNGAECVRRFRDWEKTHRSMRQFICGLAAAVGGKSICMDSGMDDCILKVNSAIHVETLVRDYVLIGKESNPVNNSVQQSLSQQERRRKNQEQQQKTTASNNMMSSSNKDKDKDNSQKMTVLHIDEDEESDQVTDRHQQEHTRSVSTDSGPDVDIQKFRQQVLGKTGNMNNFVRLFISQGERTMTKLTASVVDPTTWSACQHQAHALKGSAMMMHAQPLARSCRVLETLTSNLTALGITPDSTNPEDLESVTNMVAKVVTKWKDTVAVLQAEIEKVSP